MNPNHVLRVKLILLVKKGIGVWFSYSLILVLGLVIAKYVGYFSEDVVTLILIGIFAGLAMTFTEFFLFRKVIHIPNSLVDAIKLQVKKLHYKVDLNESDRMILYSIPGNQLLMRSLDLMLVRFAGEWYINVNIFHRGYFK